MSWFARWVSGPSPTGYQDRGKGRGRVYENITETVGNTPCVKISDAICPPGRTIYATWIHLIAGHSDNLYHQSSES